MAFKDSVEAAATQLQVMSTFESSIHIAVESVIIPCTLPRRRECIDARYKSLRATAHGNTEQDGVPMEHYWTLYTKDKHRLTLLLIHATYMRYA